MLMFFSYSAAGAAGERCFPFWVCTHHVANCTCSLFLAYDTLSMLTARMISQLTGGCAPQTRHQLTILPCSLTPRYSPVLLWEMTRRIHTHLAGVIVQTFSQISCIWNLKNHDRIASSLFSSSKDQRGVHEPCKSTIALVCTSKSEKTKPSNLLHHLLGLLSENMGRRFAE